jgi:hypothetical protein
VIIGPQDFRRDGQGRINFHEAQLFLEKYRNDRVMDNKRVYPNLSSKSTATAASSSSMNTSAALQLVGSQPVIIPKHVVSASVAPTTMFLRAQGNTNADLIEKVSFLCAAAVVGKSV